MQLPSTIREELIEELDDFIEAIAEPAVEQLVTFLLEQLELQAEEHGLDDIIADMEEEGALDGSLFEILESELESNDELEFTGEEVITLLERLVGIEWDDDDEDDDDYEDDEEEEFDEEL